jgi:hypothetical protein
MSRTKRIVIVLLAVALLILVLPNWWSSLQDYNSTPMVLTVVLVLCVLHFLVAFTALELLCVVMIITPALFTVFHVLCGMPVVEAYLLIFRCTLAFVLYFLVSSIIETYKSLPAASIPRLLTALAIALLWTFVLLGKNVLLSLSLILLVGLLLYYLRSLKRRG